MLVSRMSWCATYTALPFRTEVFVFLDVSFQMLEVQFAEVCWWSSFLRIALD